MTACSNVAIIGAGPYGLSIASHLRERGIDFRIFGSPMHSWRARMPKGMFLKSEGIASSLYDPECRYTLQYFCAKDGLAYADYNCPVSLQTFAAYGLSFQQRLVTSLEDKSVVALRRSHDGFTLQLDDGEMVTTRRVVVAVGISYFRHVPTTLAHLPSDVLSHSSDYHDLSCFKGRDVSVIGSGASALDLVASLREAGAQVRLVARRSALKWNMPADKPTWERWYPISGMGGGWRNYLFENAPMLFRRLPQDTRMQIVRTWLGPAGGWPVRTCVEQGPILLGHTLRCAKFHGGG